MSKMVGRKSLGHALLDQVASSSNSMSPLRKSIQIMAQDSPVRRSPNSSSPLRRKSIATPKAVTIQLSENDDEAERNALRLERTTSATSIQANVSDKRRSLGLGFLAHMSAPQIAERIAQCIKLSTENKINVRNAFTVEIIDFMTFMIKKQDSNMSNLQVASTSLDVSTKIYGFRVDSVHTDILKMIGGLEKVDEADSDLLPDNDNTEPAESAIKPQAKKPKKKVLHDILSTEDALAINVDHEDCFMIKMREGDSQTTDTLHQRMLPNHIFSKYYIHLYNDIVVDSITVNEQQNDVKEFPIETIDMPADSDIYRSFRDFRFQGWSIEDEPEEPEEPEPEEHNETGFHFDPDASLPDEDPISSGINYFDIEDEHEDVDRCAGRADGPEIIVDLCNIVTAPGPVRVSEYSFIQKSLNFHWAGPAHWKIRTFPKPLNGSKVVGTCNQDKIRTRKEIVLKYDDEAIQVAANKLQPSQSIKLQAKTAKTDWDEKRLVLPEDVHYNILQGKKLYLIPEMIILGNDEMTNASPITNGNVNYDYDNENDARDYCPALDNNDYDGAEDNDDDHGFGFEDDNGAATQMAFIGDNLVSVPKMVDKVSIQYSLRATKIDMKQLKKSIWKCLTSVSDKENIDLQETVEQHSGSNIKGNSRFSDVYKTLPNALTKSNVDALSFPISFVSLLHLANEKSLDISSLSDMSDLIVKQD